jgi:hypothetical protein
LLLLAFPDSSNNIEIFSNNNNDKINGNGARKIKIYGLKTKQSVHIDTEIINMNGKQKVYLADTWWRIHKAEVITAGNHGTNISKITVRGRPNSPNYCTIQQSDTTSTSGVFTVPAYKQLIIKKIMLILATKKGDRVHANIALNVRDNEYNDSAFIRKKNFNIQAGIMANFNYDAGLIIDEGSDIKLTVIETTEKDCVISGEIEYFLVSK